MVCTTSNWFIQKQRTERAVGHLPPVIHTHCTATTIISPMWHTILIGTVLQSNKTIKREILKDLANNAKLQPAADQSTSAAYTGSDLMAAVASPTVDPANANKKMLTLKFEHLHALLVLKPMGLVNCVPRQEQALSMPVGY